MTKRKIFSYKFITLITLWGFFATNIAWAGALCETSQLRPLAMAEKRVKTTDIPKWPVLEAFEMVSETGQIKPLVDKAYIKAAMYMYVISVAGDGEDAAIELQCYRKIFLDGTMREPFWDAPLRLRLDTSYSVGRNKRAYLETPDPKRLLSGLHFRLKVTWDEQLRRHKLKVKDLGSKNGTYAYWSAPIPKDAGDASSLVAMAGTLRHGPVNGDVRLARLKMVNNNIPAFIVTRKSNGDYDVTIDSRFYEPSIHPKTIKKYRQALINVLNNRRLGELRVTLGEMLCSYESARIIALGYFALSDFQLRVMHDRYEGVKVENEDKVVEDICKFLVEKKSIFGINDDNTHYRWLCLQYILRLSGLRSLMDLRYKGQDLGTYAKQLLIADLINEDERPRDERVRVVLRSAATAADWLRPNVMIVDDIVYQLPDNRRIPDKEGRRFHGEIIVFAWWKGRIFMFYTARTHTVEGVVAHQWRSCDGYYAGILQKFGFHDPSGRYIDKQFPNAENMNDVPGKLNILLDIAVYSTLIQNISIAEFIKLMWEKPSLMNKVLSGKRRYKRLEPPLKSRLLAQWRMARRLASTLPSRLSQLAGRGVYRRTLTDI